MKKISDKENGRNKYKKKYKNGDSNEQDLQIPTKQNTPK